MSEEKEIHYYKKNYMKKPLYYLDNYEKNRILEMHKTATKKQYITENPGSAKKWDVYQETINNPNSGLEESIFKS